MDPEERRRHIVEAVERLIMRSGVEAASLRNVADEAGLNVGSVRHYFASHESMLVAAYESLVAGFEVRAGATVERVLTDGSLSPVGRAVAVLSEALPLDEERRREVVIYFAFAESSRWNAALEPYKHQLLRGLRELSRWVLVAVGVSDETEVEAMAALLDGLSFAMIHAPDAMSADVAQGVVRSRLEALVRPGDRA